MAFMPSDVVKKGDFCPDIYGYIYNKVEGEAKGITAGHSSTIHRSIFRISLLKLMPILNNLRGSEAKGNA